jgi:putative SOS response-associated peptidase YedK
MLWGYPTTKPRKTPPKPGQEPFTVDWWTNARDLTKSLWKGSLADPAHRCLVPFQRFAEPKAAADRKEPRDLNWWFTVVDRPGAAFAGIWKDDPRFGRVYSFCTTAPNPLVGAVHPKAMPVILDEGDYDRWLTADWPDAQSLVTAYPSQLMTIA